MRLPFSQPNNQNASTHPQQQQRMISLFRIFLAVALVAAIGAATWIVIMKSFNSSQQQQLAKGLDGCFDPISGDPFSLFASTNDPVSQTSGECEALKDLAVRFGFGWIDGSLCLQNTTIVNPADSSSFLQAGFCDPTTVYSFRVYNPPIPLSEYPNSLLSFRKLWGLGLHNAFYGSKVLDPLFKTLATPPYLAVLNLTGSVENQKNNSRIMSGEIPEIPRNLKFLQAIFLANNNFSGSIPSSLSDTIGLITFANNTFLSGPLPASSIQLKSQTPQWTNTMRCNFNGTGLCVPPNWKYQPACIRTIANSIPTCSNDSLPVSSAPVLGIDPRDPGPLLLQPFPDSQDNTPAFGSFSDVLRYAGISIFFMIVLAGTWIWWRNRMYRDAYNRALTQEQERQQVEERRRMEEFELPEYTPALPEYHHNATPGASTGGVVSERREEAPFIVSTGGTHGTGTDSERNPRTVS